MAKKLYDYWFVQFDFPDEKGKPYKSSGGKMVYNEVLKREIPEGWEVKNLPFIANFKNGLACQKYRPINDTDKLPVIKIDEIHNGFDEKTEFVKSDIPESVKVYNGDILFSWSASLEVVIWNGGNGGLNQHIFKVTSNNNYPLYYIYYQLLNYVGIFKKMAEARKTTMGHITIDHLNQSTIAVPVNDLTILNDFEKRVKSINESITNYSEQIQKLTNLRNRLLPLLMNGQVTVKQQVNCDLLNKICSVGLEILIFTVAGLQIQQNKANPAEQGYFLLLKTESNRKRICFFRKCLYISTEKILLWKQTLAI